MAMRFTFTFDPNYGGPALTLFSGKFDVMISIGNGTVAAASRGLPYGETIPAIGDTFVMSGTVKDMIGGEAARTEIGYTPADTVDTVLADLGGELYPVPRFAPYLRAVWGYLNRGEFATAAAVLTEMGAVYVPHDIVTAAFEYDRATGTYPKLSTIRRGRF